MLSAQHCMAIGFDVSPTEGADFPFDSITYWSESPKSEMAYFTIFKCDGGYRANMFGYWQKASVTMTSLRNAPDLTLLEIMPNLFRSTGKFTVSSPVRIRPIDLYSVENPKLDGVVLVGDAFSTSCPGAGTGAGKALIDVERLCGTYIPDWLRGSQVDAAMIRQFYHDGGKCENDTSSLNEAYFLQSISLDRSPSWMTKRLLRFGYHWLKGTTKGIPLEPLFMPQRRRQTGMTARISVLRPNLLFSAQKSVIRVTITRVLIGHGPNYF